MGFRLHWTPLDVLIPSSCADQKKTLDLSRRVLCVADALVHAIAHGQRVALTLPRNSWTLVF